MFTALILVCVSIEPNGDDYCQGAASPIVWETFEECTEALYSGVPYMEDLGWRVESIGCYNWKQPPGKNL